MSDKRHGWRTAGWIVFAALTLASADARAVEGSASFNPDTVATDPTLAAKLPEHIAKAGVLTVGSDTSYAPWEYISATDGQTPEGIDVDLAKALAKTLGVRLDFQTADFNAILPALGPKYDLGISAFSITNKRMEVVNFVSYTKSGNLWAVKAGNPAGFDIGNICGRTVAVQSGSYHEGAIQKESKDCVAAGKAAVEIIPFSRQTEALTRVVAGGADATLSGSATIGYAVKQSNGQLDIAGAMGEFGLNGIAIAKTDTALTELVAEVMNKLIKDGTYGRIYAAWGVDTSTVAAAEINPKAAE